MDKLINILLIEDDYLDAIDIQRTLDKMSILYQLHIARNGEEAIEMLEGRGENFINTLPDLVMVDINMPKMNGLEFIAVLRSREEWKALKCFIITTSDEKVDREAAKALDVSGYIVKPLKLNSTSSRDAFNLTIDLLNLKR